MASLPNKPTGQQLIDAAREGSITVSQFTAAYLRAEPEHQSTFVEALYRGTPQLELDTDTFLAMLRRTSHGRPVRKGVRRK